MDDLVAFLRARLDEKAARAQAAGGDEWSLHGHESDTVLIYSSHGEPVVYDEGSPAPAQARHIVDHSPARVLREVEAKRRLVDQYERAMENRRAHPDDLASAGALLALHGAVKLFALPFDVHPDYRPKWAPEGSST
jgi:hypothetical protein